MSLSTNGEIGKYDYSFKMIVIGDAGVGKSCLTNRAAKDKFISNYSPTIGFEFLSFSTNIDNKIVKLQIWDTCGQEVYRSLISNFYRNSSLAVLLYAIDNRESFINANNWLKELKGQASPDVKIMIVGNKCDLEEERKVSIDEGKEFKEKNNLNCFMETSAKTGENAKNAINEAAKILYRDYLDHKIKGSITENEKKGKNLGDKSNIKDSRKCC